MAQALERVKQEFGREAVILTTRTVRKGGLLGVGGRPSVEITAAQGLVRFTPPVRRDAAPNPPPQGPPSCGPSRQGEAQTEMGLLVAELSSIKTIVQDLARQARRGCGFDIPANLFEDYCTLVQNAVAEELAAQFIQRVEQTLGPSGPRDAESVRMTLQSFIAETVPVSGPLRVGGAGAPSTVALIGPTGVGKTTTIAKLAANLTLQDRRKVGLITIDTYRIAAVEQLRTYARILDVPLKVVSTPFEFRDAVLSLSSCEVILIDTAGRGQRDTLRLRELRDFFSTYRPDEIHLVLSSTGSEKSLLDIVERFREVSFDRVIFSKLDEALGFGVVLGCLSKARAALSYVTTGQSVPDDISVGNPTKVAQAILNDRAFSTTGVLDEPAVALELAR